MGHVRGDDNNVGRITQALEDDFKKRHKKASLSSEEQAKRSERRALNKKRSVERKKENAIKYPNGGEPWGRDEEARLKEKFLAGLSLEELAKIHGRSSGGIKSRLKHLKLISK